jgi:hypothetical protein
MSWNEMETLLDGADLRHASVEKPIQSRFTDR